MKRLKFLIYTRPFIVFAYYLIQIYSLTFRLKVENEAHWMNHLKNGTPVLLCAWHQQFFSAIRHFKTYAKYNPGLMISKSRDGDLISGVARRTGWRTARGSSSRGGRSAMNTMIAHLKTFGFGAHLLDGPTGPMGKVKSGVIKMARETGAVVVPFYARADQAWFFNSWDRFMLPKPFSRVWISYGEGLRFESTGDDQEFEEQRRFLEQTMLPKLFYADEKD